MARAMTRARVMAQTSDDESEGNVDNDDKGNDLGNECMGLHL